MNDRDQLELQQLRARQMRLQKEVDFLGAELARLEDRFKEPRAALPEDEGAGIQTLVQPLPPATELPPVIAAHLASQRFEKEPHNIPLAAPIRVQLPEAAKDVEPHPLPVPVPKPAPTSSPTIPPVTRQPAAENQSFEMRLGTYWLVRIGIVMVLTALVFFGNLAYHNFIVKLGPGGKVGLLYFASLGLLAAGTWWQRKAAKESLRNYAQVLFAGGLAAVYFTTYAAHHFPNLMVIPNATIDGLLLLGWAAFMTWIADRKKSEVLAFFAVGLAYYTSIITHVGHFTLYSNLLLTGVAVAFLVRNRWANLSFASIAATYGSYAFWQFFDRGDWHWTSGTPNTALGLGEWFLIGYWLVFTAGVFLCRSETFANQPRSLFLSANNGAFVSLFLLTMLQLHQGAFWKFFLICGVVLLGLAWAARRALPQELLPTQAYLIQGLLLVTIGLITKYSGLQLALLLGAESTVLLFLGESRKNAILRGAAYIAAGLAVGWGMDSLEHFNRPLLFMGVGLGALMVTNMLLAGREPDDRLLRPGPTYFSALALLIWFLVDWHNTTTERFPAVLALICLAMTLSVYVLRGRELALFSQLFLLIGHAFWIVNSVGHPTIWWQPAVLIAATVALSHWWPRQKAISAPVELTEFIQAIYALALMGVIYFWLSPKYQPAAWMVLTSLLAAGIAAYGLGTRAWWIAAFSQLFLFVSVGQFFLQFAQRAFPPGHSLVPIAAVAIFSAGTVFWFKRGNVPGKANERSFLQAALVYRWCALLMSLVWIYQHIPAKHQVWVLSVIGLAVFAWSGFRQSREGLLFAVPYIFCAVASFWFPLLDGRHVRWLDLAVVVVLVAQQRVFRRNPARYALEPWVHTFVIALAGASLWMFISRLVMQSLSGFYLTASWSVFAFCLFAVGILIRERAYRWLGLAVLGAALGRVVIFDVWRLETIYRILSFLALGIVLLALGFIYNKYQEKIREWL